MEKISNACLLLDISEERLLLLARTIQKVFDEIGVDSEISISDYHVSVGYVVGNTELEHLVNVAKEIAESPVRFKFSGIEILKGITTNCDYVVLKIAKNEELEYAIDLISESAETRTFEDGFKTHLTLLTIQKNGILDSETVARFLELKVLGILSSFDLVADGISIFSDERKRVAHIPLPNAI